MDCKNPIEIDWKGLKKYFNKTHLLRCNDCWHKRPEVIKKIKETLKKTWAGKSVEERKRVYIKPKKYSNASKKRIDSTRKGLLTSANKVNTLVRAYSTNYVNLDIEWEYPFTEDIPKLERNKLFQVALFADLAIPFSRNQSTAFSRSPSHSVNAFLQSIIPAPVCSRKSLTKFALIIM